MKGEHMANTLTPIDVYQIVNELASQTLGGTNDIKVVDTSTFVTVGEKLLRTGTENVLNAISAVVGRTIFSVRPYRQKLGSLTVEADRWGAQTRKVVYLYNETEASTDYNTDISPNQLANGNSIDMYPINSPGVVQLNFYGTKKLQKHITRFRDQLAIAFRNEGEFVSFLNGMMTEFNNEIEVANEVKTRAALLNYMAGISSMGLTEVDLTKAYNDRFGTSYTREQLLSTHMSDFMKFMAGQIKIYSSRLTDFGFNHHANLTGTLIPRHTPKAFQKMVMYEPIFIEAQSQVYSSLFNPRYLEIGSYEGVNYWQSQNSPTEINILPNILDVATGASKDAEAAVNLPYVIGVLFDREACGVVPQFDYSSTTPFNSAGGYFNTYVHWRFNAFNDFTENGILFVMGAGGSGDPGTREASIPVKKTRAVARGEVI